MDHKRTFSKEEISKILTRASEIQTKKDLYGEEQSLTEEELIHIAEEVGIDRDSLFEAIHSYHIQSGLDIPFNWLNANSKIQEIQTIPGEVTEDRWEEVVQEIRRVTGGIGKLNKVGKSFEWEQRRKEIGYKHISLSPLNNATKVQLVSSWSGVKTMAYIFSAFAGVTLSGILLDGSGIADVPAALIVLGGALLALPFGHFFLKHYFEKQKAQLNSLITSISKKLRPAEKAQITIEDEEVYSAEKPASDASKVRS